MSNNQLIAITFNTKFSLFFDFRSSNEIQSFRVNNSIATCDSIDNVMVLSNDSMEFSDLIVLAKQKKMYTYVLKNRFLKKTLCFLFYTIRTSISILSSDYVKRRSVNDKKAVDE